MPKSYHKFLTPLAEMPHSSPSLNEVTHPTCSSTDVFLLVLGWRTLTERMGHLLQGWFQGIIQGLLPETILPTCHRSFLKFLHENIIPLGKHFNALREEKGLQSTLNHRCLTLSNPLSYFIYSTHCLTFQPFEIRTHPLIHGMLNLWNMVTLLNFSCLKCES